MLPKQARYQLRYTRLWNCVICGLSCGLGRFLTNGFAEMVPASGSVPAGCGVGLFSSWMGPVCSQSRRATNCATPGYLIFSNCGQTCGHGRFLTNGFAEMVPASASAPAGCGVGLFPSWMGGICSQSRRATNCATPGYEVFQLWSNMWSIPIANP